MDHPKIFGIGFQKTGTTSLATALTRLGYRVTGPNWIEDPRIGERVRELAFATVGEFDAFQDNPWPLLYRDLDERYPGSRFVLTVRDPDQWISSVVRHFGKGETPMRCWIYGHGSPVGHEGPYIDRYRAHNAEVREYFRGRPDDLLVLDITAGDGWEKLCPFLGVEIPSHPFPHSNQASRRKWKARRRSVEERVRTLLERLRAAPR